MDVQTQRQFEEWQVDKEIAPMESFEKTEQLKLLWKMYLRQKADEEKTGIDTRADIERMRKTFGMAKRGELTADIVDATFPDPAAPIGTDPQCGDEGWFFNREAEFVFRTKPGEWRTAVAPGIEVCNCNKGLERLNAIKSCGSQRKKGFRA